MISLFIIFLGATKLVFTQTIVFGSCHKVNDPSSDLILKSIANQSPDAFIWLGDMVYGKDGTPNTSANDLTNSNPNPAIRTSCSPPPFTALGTTTIMA